MEVRKVQLPLCYTHRHNTGYAAAGETELFNLVRSALLLCSCVVILAGNATLTSGLLLGRSEVLRSLRHYLRAQSQGHHTIDRLEERGVERGSARRSFLKGRERVIVSQTNIYRHRFKGNDGETSERLGGAHMGFSERIDTILK